MTLRESARYSASTRHFMGIYKSLDAVRVTDNAQKSSLTSFARGTQLMLLSQHTRSFLHCLQLD
jgi:hypothetical protein